MAKRAIVAVAEPPRTAVRALRRRAPLGDWTETVTLAAAGRSAAGLELPSRASTLTARSKATWSRAPSLVPSGARAMASEGSAGSVPAAISDRSASPSPSASKPERGSSSLACST